MFVIYAEYTEVYIDCESSIRRSPSTRPPAMLPHDANVTNQEPEQSKGGVGNLPGETLGQTW